jgi:hypothetical protein
MPDSTSGSAPFVRYYPYRTFDQYSMACVYPVAPAACLAFLLAFLHYFGGATLPSFSELLPLVLCLETPSVAGAIAMILQARYVYVGLTPDGLVRQSWLGKRASAAWDEVQEAVWRPERIGIGTGFGSTYRVLEVLYTGADSRQRKMGIAGGAMAEANAQRIRDDIIQRLGLVQLPPRGRREVWARPSTAPPPPG